MDEIKETEKTILVSVSCSCVKIPLQNIQGCPVLEEKQNYFYR